MASLFIKTLAVLNIEAARALAREEGEGRSAPPTKEPVETAAKPVKNAVSKEDAAASSQKGEIRWQKFGHKQAGSILVPQNQGEVGKWNGPDGWAWMRVATAHDWAKAKDKAAQDGRWWIILEGGKLWGWSPPNVRPVTEGKAPEVSKEATSPVKEEKSSPATEPAKEENPISSPVGEALGKLPARPKRTKKASTKEVEDKKE